jgi:probable addiction module antidote protein
MSFLNQALADEDVEAFKLSLKDIIRVHGKVSHLAKEAHLSRGTLYKLMQGKGQTEIGTVLKLIHALNRFRSLPVRPRSRRWQWM